MSWLLRPCKLEMDFELYVHFLLQHHDQLNLPYAYGMKLSFIGSPLLLGKAMLMFDEETYRLAGAAGCVYGTGAGDFEDRHICQIEVMYICDEDRGGLLFAQALHTLLDWVRTDNPAVERVQFWASADDESRLFARFAALPGASRTINNRLALYAAPFEALESHLRSYRRPAGLRTT